MKDCSHRAAIDRMDADYIQVTKVVFVSLDLERISSTLSSTDSEKPRRENKKVKSRKVTKAQLNELEKVRKELAEKEKDLEVAQEKINDMEEKEKEMRNR